MQLTVLTDRHDPSIASDFARAARNLTKPDPSEVRVFCERLTGLRGETPDEICDEVADLALPIGYMHVRVFNAADGLQIVSLVSRTSIPVSGRELAIVVTHQDRCAHARWSRTSPLPTRDKGVLDLLVEFEPHERSKAA